jgi:DNA modification methylase
MIKSHNKSIYETLGREPVHPFPARMAPGIALDIVAQAKTSLRVLDPMMGSGTVLAVARSKGHHAIGIDIDPLAVLISRVWTTAVNPTEAKEKAVEVLDRARTIFATLPTRNAYPSHADDETRGFIAFWFDPYARRQLVSLALAISHVRDVVIREVLWCGFSRLIITKQSGASLAMDLSHSRPHKSFEKAPVKPFDKFLLAVDRVVANCIDNRSSGRGPATRTHEGDARALPLGNASIDLVLTSPPYLNAIDYFRCSKFSLIWMGYSVSELRQLRADSVGAEACRKAIMDDAEIRNVVAELKLRPKLGVRDEALLWRYIDDMRGALREVSRVLVPGGKAVYIVGENTIKGTFVRNSVAVAAVAELAGLRLSERQTRALPANRRYLPPPSKGSRVATMDTRMRREVVLAFTRAA